LRRDDADIFGGMIAGTVFGVLFVPVLFVSVQRLFGRGRLG
jgi:multidrug efflux pump subunit AcrB